MRMGADIPVDDTATACEHSQYNFVHTYATQRRLLRPHRSCRRDVTLARLRNQNGPLQDVDPPAQVGDRATHAELVQRDRHGMSRAANHLGQHFVGDGQ